MKRSGMAILSIAFIFFLAGSPAQAQKFNLTLSGASPGGLWSRIGGGFDAAIAAAYPGSTITYQTSPGAGLANIGLVSRGKVPMGIATDGEVTLALKGLAPFRSPIRNIRVLFRAYAPAARFQATHVILNKTFADKYGITSFADIVRKKAPVRVAINRRGNMDGDIGEMVMTEQGASLAAIKSWGGQVRRAASKEMVSLMLDRRIDMVVLGIAYRHPRIREIARGIKPVLLDIPMAVAQKVKNQMGGQICKFRKGEYKFSNRDITSICVGALIIVNKSMDRQLAYNLAKGTFTQIEKFKTAHRLIKKTATPQSMSVPAIIPFHPGTAKYLREAGLLR